LPPPLAVEAFAELPGRWQHASVDVTDASSVNRAFQEHAIEQVIYGAAITSGADREREHPEQVIGVNLTGAFLCSREALKIMKSQRSGRIINIGSVGQPRDSNNNAKYVIWDSAQDTLEVRFIPYDVAAVVKKIKAAGLPKEHAERLW